MDHGFTDGFDISLRRHTEISAVCMTAQSAQLLGTGILTTLKREKDKVSEMSPVNSTGKATDA